MANIRAGHESRRANDQIYNVLWGVGAGDGRFLCECTGMHCTEEVQMTLAEYVRLCDRDELLFAPGHESPIS